MTAHAKLEPVFKEIEVRPLTPAIGAEIGGIDLSLALSESKFAEIHAAFLRYQVIFFRDQPELTPEQQMRFGRMFGELHLHPAAPHLENHPEIFVIHTHKDSKVSAGEAWHSDVTCDAEPPMATMLQIHILPSFGGDTMFSSMYSVYDSLSDDIKEFLSGKFALHESQHIYQGRYSDRGIDDAGKKYPEAEHPIVRTHPETGRPAIFVNCSFTTKICGLKKDESDAILNVLFKKVENPYFQVRFKWTKNAIALWDNRCVQHIAIWDYHPNERKGHRVTIQGDKPFFHSDTP